MDSKELDLDAPFDVFLDVEDLRRLPSPKVFLISQRVMHIIDPLVDLLPPEACLSDGIATHLLTDIDAMLFIERCHNSDLLRSLMESKSFDSFHYGLFLHRCYSLRRGHLLGIR